jgi:hypothetical protein
MTLYICGHKVRIPLLARFNEFAGEMIEAPRDFITTGAYKGYRRSKYLQRTYNRAMLLVSMTSRLNQQLKTFHAVSGYTAGFMILSDCCVQAR